MNKNNGIPIEIGTNFRIAAYRSPASEHDIDRLNAFSPLSIPADYFSLVRKMTDVEVYFGDDIFIRIWGPSRCLEINEAYEIQRNLPGSVAVGDDEGGSALIYMQAHKGFGLYLSGFGALDAEGVEFLAPSITMLFKHGVQNNRGAL